MAYGPGLIRRYLHANFRSRTNGNEQFMLSEHRTIHSPTLWLHSRNLLGGTRNISTHRSNWIDNLGVAGSGSYSPTQQGIPTHRYGGPAFKGTNIHGPVTSPPATQMMLNMGRTDYGCQGGGQEHLTSQQLSRTPTPRLRHSSSRWPSYGFLKLNHTTGSRLSALGSNPGYGSQP